MQAKLLRVLQEKRYRRIGDNKDRLLHCRIISSTNVEPQQAINDGQLREDLYYRISTVTINLPPLRKRIEDISLLMHYFINKLNKYFNTKFEYIDGRLLQACTGYHWPGNVRELERMIESALALSDTNEKILLLDLFPILGNQRTLEQVSQKLFDCTEKKRVDLNEELHNYERDIINAALQGNEGNITTTAKQLSIHRSVLYNKMKKLGIRLK
jgi:arginine utilization regulatory protein